MTKREEFSQKGFTLPELLVVGGVFVILVLVSAWLIRPDDYGPDQRNAERVTETAQLMQVFNRFVQDTGTLPAGLSDKEQLLGTDEEGIEEDMLDICPDLVPKYLKDLPWDPQAGGSANEVMCHVEESYYTTGYIVQLKGSTVTISAPVAEYEEEISLSRTYPKEVKSPPLEAHDHEH